MRYAIVIEKGERNYSAYFPDLPGCIATGKNLVEVTQRMSEAIELHLRGLREDRQPNKNQSSATDN
jgi:predicted RNase H-like HicB family nuclease